MPRPKANIWRKYFVFNSERNVNTCLVETNEVACGKEIKGDHGSNLTQHIKRQHGNLFDKATQDKCNEQALSKNNEAHKKDLQVYPSLPVTCKSNCNVRLTNVFRSSDESYTVINEAELDKTDIYYGERRRQEKFPTTHSGENETTSGSGQQEVETNAQHSSTKKRQRTIKREMSEDINFDPRSDEKNIQKNHTKAEDINEDNLIDSTKVTTFIFKGEEYVQMPKEHYLKEKRYLLSELLRFKSIINDVKLKLDVAF